MELKKLPTMSPITKENILLLLPRRGQLLGVPHGHTAPSWTRAEPPPTSGRAPPPSSGLRHCPSRDLAASPPLMAPPLPQSGSLPPSSSRAAHRPRPVFLLVSQCGAAVWVEEKEDFLPCHSMTVWAPRVGGSAMEPNRMGKNDGVELEG